MFEWNGCFNNRMIDYHKLIILLILNLIIQLNNNVCGEILTPPYFNLAEGRKITATATCGVDTEGPELYCKLVGANAENDINVNVIQGHFCDYCDPTRPDKMHPPEFAVDGMETWWQSPPLSRGNKYNEVNLTIDLGQEFHVAYVYIRMGNSPRPGLWVLEKSADYGKTYTPWQYFSDSPADCETYFGRESLQPITRDDSVICNTEYSKIVPLEGGEIPISILNNRPSANNYFNSTVLQEWTRATNVRLRLLRTKNFLGHLMSVIRQDPTVTRRYFYSIKDISIGGRCMCNGHAESCDIQDPEDPSVLLCRCQHNTCGAKCNRCCSGFEQKAWRQSKHNHPFACERCNCFQHSNECIYSKEVDQQHLSLDIHGRYEGGGVCQNCQHNTEGINCNKCKEKFYRPYHKHWNETDVCQPCSCSYFYSTGNCAEGSGQCECRKEFTPPLCDSCSFGYYDYPNCKPCDCFLNGTKDLQCETIDGQCPCLYNFGGKYCRECANGFYNFSECKSCECNPGGSISSTCDQETGNCTCKNNFNGKHCDECQDGYFNYPECTYCNCDIKGTEQGVCTKETGQCICKEGYGGDRCDTCILGYYGYPDCQPCNCSKVGSLGTTCTSNGKCSCLVNYAGKTCDQCSPGYYKYPECLSCECDTHGSNGVSCDSEGKCECHYNFAGLRCNTCKEGYYNFPACEDCNCHPAGVVAGFAGCGSVPAGELCQCKDRVEGRICNKCKPLYWNLNPNNPSGCEECNCNIPGVLSGIATCDSDNGQCVCKSLVVGRGCTECTAGTYNLEENNLFGCADCNCDIGGSVNNNCDKISGNCLCQNRVTGRTCKEPLKAHYFPTLYQYQYEVEDGRTPANTVVRYANDENVFPQYSWKGYAVFSLLQSKIIQDVYIYKPSLYHMVLRFVNKNPETVYGTIKITPDNPSDIEQEFQVKFHNSSVPAFVTVAKGNIPSPFVMNPGRWQISIEVPKSLFLDYFVFLPEDFYLATILNKKVEKPCTVNDKGLCRDYTYPNLTQFDTVFGVNGYIQSGTELTEFFQDYQHLATINVGNRVPVLNLAQANLSFNITVTKSGQYVIVIKYVTSLDDERTHKVSAVIKTSQNIYQNGNLLFYSCPYTSLCRQAVTNEEGTVGIYLVEDNHIQVDLHGSDANVGIHSITAIPANDWSLNYIKPKSFCIRKDGNCISATFRYPPETKKIQFEEGLLDSAIELSNSTYIQLNSVNNSIEIKGRVPTNNYYTFIVHYYQPNFQDFDIKVLISERQNYEANLPIQHIPSLSGGRSVISQNDGNYKFYLSENFTLNLTIPNNNKNVYIDYLLVVPSDYYNDRYLEEENVDRSGEFISTCGSNHFNIDTTMEGFCRDSVFSITAGHNSGALPCQCDYDGSLSFECDKFGGQCQCKPNIIGRKCEACKTGYYGFPDCKPCNCPSTAYCQPNTGQCICPPHVTGEKCDQCEQLTYGFDPIIGCEECKCNPLGVAYNSLQCDLMNGTCPCKANIFGRQCDICVPGYYAFPYCESCECDIRGTNDDICNQETAECFCKKNVIGPSCELCREGTFNLQANNEDGCTECFCFGKTTRCQSSKLIKISLVQMNNWSLVQLNTSFNLDITHLNLTVQNVDQNTVGFDFTATDLKNTTIYFSAPNDYIGKKLTIYGSFINYTIFYTIGSKGSAVNGPDLILLGNKTYLTYSSLEQPPPAFEYSTSVQFVESNFDLPNGIPAKRQHIMELLEDLKGIYIRATYWTDSVTTSLLNVIQEDAIPYEYYNEDHRNLALAYSVEDCQCPPNYQGLSCEECAPGYYRIESGPHGGYCVPCQCHGHATECDVNTGHCFNCTHNTRGDHCELCDVGYHGNALAGTPMDCLICACPLPITSNNFAKACDVSSDGEKISCECNEGYIGARCQSCAAGFYGRPESAGDYCKPCQCSGNINPDDPSSCDTVTGDCLRCLNNTFGKACSLCAPGYFGDAIALKDCQTCVCDELGTDHCNSYTGECVCKPNVVGEKCDRCTLEHYGFQSGQGCVPCNCGVASDSDQCDDVNGQCRCKPGVSGRVCDRCSGGYWNYTSEGCVSCGCKSEYSLGFGCNARTGQCECLQGVIGEKCDQCPHRWAFIQDYGCHQCDSCTHALLDDTDRLSALIDPIIIDFDSANSGYFTRRKLDNMEALLSELKLKFGDVDPKQINLEPLFAVLESLEQDSKNLNRKTNYSLDNSESLKTNAEELNAKSEELINDLVNAEVASLSAIEEINKITFQLDEDESPEIELALQLGEQTLNDIKKLNITYRENNAKKELNQINDLLKNVTEFKLPADNLNEKVAIIRNDFKDFNDKLDDLYNQTQYSLNKAKEAEKVIEKIGKDRLKKKLQDIENKTIESENNLEISENHNINSTKFNEEAKSKYRALRSILDNLEVHNNEFKTTLDNNDDGISEIEELKPTVQEHANNLTNLAMELDRLSTETRDVANNPVTAPLYAYKDIVEAVKNARKAAIDAQFDSDKAVDLLNGVEDKTFEAGQLALNLLKESDNLHETTTDDLEPKLEYAKENWKSVDRVYKNNDEKLKDIERKLKNLQIQSLDDAYNNAIDNAELAIEHVGNIDATANKTFSELKNQTEQAKYLSKDCLDTKTNMLQIKKQLNTTNEMLPELIDRIDKLPNKLNLLPNVGDRIQDSINKLNQQIALARDIANQVKIGMKFYPNTTLELRNPSNLEDLSTSTRISGYFKTNKPYGLLWYLGNPTGTNLRRTKTDDYMALIIQNGYPVLKLDIGNGPEQLINEKYVSDDKWYQFIIDRTGHNAKLSIREELSGGIENITQSEMTLDGPYSIFNLDKNKSKLFVGSFPINYEMQKDIDINSFDGEIEDFVVGETPMSLWNFVNGYENNHGAKERDKLVNLQSSTGYRFNGNGYVILNARSYSFRTRSHIQLSFKTFATEGLLFLTGKDNKFIALELRNGKILYQYNMGFGTKLWHTSKTYNDGKWHVIRASRDGSKGLFMVDNEDIPDRTKSVGGTIIETNDTIAFGGYPNKHQFRDVTNTKFDGCIDNVSLMGTPVNLQQYIKVYDVTPGCPVKVARMVSFAKHKPGYVNQNSLSVSNDFKVSLKFKTKEIDGLIFYATDQLHTANISLSLKDGHLILISQKIELVSKDMFNDSEWHVVAIMHNDRELRVDFDDYGYKVTDSPPPRLDILHGNLYIGGLPRRVLQSITIGTIGSNVPFSGCIGDFTFNGNVINFANTTDKFNDILGKCILDDNLKDISDIDKAPVLPPVQKTILTTTYQPETTTKDFFDSHTTIRGDGGVDYKLTEQENLAPIPEQIPVLTTSTSVYNNERIGYSKSTTPKPPPTDSCALPLQPAKDDDESSNNGIYRFGTQKSSRIEYSSGRGKYRKQFDFSLEFKTNSDNGIIFYVSDTNIHTDYVSLFLQNGKVTYTFSGGNGAAILQTNERYDDNLWHFVEFSREESKGKLVIDSNASVVYGGTLNPTQKIDIKPSFYIGGLEPKDYNIVLGNLNTTEPFKGCIRNFNMNSKPMENPTLYGVIPCSDNVETGTFFSSGEGFIKLRERFHVGEIFNIKLDIKPRLESGVLIAVHGRKDYFVMEMVKGVMKLTVENGKGPIIASYNPNNKFYFCDGKWHTIQAVKSQNVVTLSVDNVFTNPSLGDHHSTSTDTGSALFLGGHRLIKRVRGITTRIPYVGCVKNVYINNDPAEILPSMANGNVTVGSCPTN